MVREDTLLNMPDGSVVSAKEAVLSGKCIVVPEYHIQWNKTFGNIFNLAPKWETEPGHYTDKQKAQVIVNKNKGRARIKTVYSLKVHNTDSYYSPCLARLKNYGYPDYRVETGL